MHKPNYIKIKLPASKKYFGTMAKQYLVSLIGTKAQIEFGKERQRKIFEYEIINFEPIIFKQIEGKKKQYSFNFEMLKQK